MALEMSNATYAVSQEGIAKLKSNFESDFKRSQSLLRGQKYTDLLKVINENWSGADKDAFVQKLEKQIDTLNASYNSFYKIVTDALDQRYNEFMRFQTYNK